MNTSNIIYQGDLRTEATHIGSGQSIITDAPLDNQGKGEAFSPTDLVATALGTCMLTVMGKDPRRIVEVKINIEFGNRIKPDDRVRLERAAHSCPVGNSLHSDLKEMVEFIYT